jgi:Protein of unknown function (DUF664)
VTNQCVLTQLFVAAGVFQPPARFAKKEEMMEQSPKLLIECESGYSPHIGVLVSTLARCREKTITWLQDLTIKQLDYLWDENANTIGALLLHLAGLEVVYQELSFKGAIIDNNPELMRKWGVALALDEPARQQIRGYPIDYYLSEFHAVRAVTLQQFRHYDDDWLWQEVPFPWRDFTVNNYWMWYHVYEDEINHRGEINWLKSRIPAV